MSDHHRDNLYFLAFDHRDSFERKLIGVDEVTAEDARRIADAKSVVYDGLLWALESGGVTRANASVLIDEHYGEHILRAAKAANLRSAVPVERSGQRVFDFEYGEGFAAHIEKLDPDFAKVLVRYNPTADAAMNELQLARLRRLSDWLQERDRQLLFELLVPATPEQLRRAGGDSERYRRQLRPRLTRLAIADIQAAGVAVDVWKLEGVDERAQAEMLVAQAQEGEGRSRVRCILLGADAPAERLEHWLELVGGVDGFNGFAIGRSVWWEVIQDFLTGSLGGLTAAQRIAARYLRFVQAYERGALAAKSGNDAHV